MCLLQFKKEDQHSIYLFMKLTEQILDNIVLHKGRVPWEILGLSS